MKNIKNRIFAMTAIASLSLSLLTGCSSEGGGNSTSTTENTDTSSESTTAESKSTDSSSTNEEKTATSDVTLELETSWTNEKLDALNQILTEFTAETGIGVEVIAPGDDYENVMKTRMASGDLPDLWETHGWSTTRYSEYLEPLNDEDWVSTIKESIKATVTDPEGNIYVAPLSIDPASICYNKDIFEEAGIVATDILTWDDFEAACEKIKALDKIPVYVGGKSVNNIANLFEVIAPGFLTNDGIANNHGEALLDGSFNWEEGWTPIAEMINDWLEKGYFNKDILTASDDASIQGLANGDGAIVISGNHTITQALAYNPEARLGIMAIPAANEGENVYISSGEGTCYGMWKDTEYPDECKQLLSYLISNEVSEKIATINGKIPAVEGVTNDEEYVTVEFNDMMEAHADNLIFIDYFDRAYLPSGMWNDMGVSGNEIFMSPGESGIKKCVEVIKTAFEEKFTQ